MKEGFTKMGTITKENILEALKGIKHKDQDQNIVEKGLVSAVDVSDNMIIVTMEVSPKLISFFEETRLKVEEEIEKIAGSTKVSVVLTAKKDTQKLTEKPKQAPQIQKMEIKGVKKIIAVASGKGGVGKSTVSVNLAMALSSLGLKTALFDADIYGPSLPKMMGLENARPESVDGKHFLPIEQYGVECMSLGFMVDPASPVIWRGPMVSSAIEQLLGDASWGDIDVMVIDLPPGTGDAQLMMSQKVPLDGAIIVSTPQDIALLDAVKGLNMFHKVGTDIIGVIENMSYFICPSCGTRSEIFGHGGAKQTAEELGEEFLGAVPLHIDIRKHADEGSPIVVSDPEAPQSKAFIAIAEKVKQAIGY